MQVLTKQNKRSAKIKQTKTITQLNIRKPVAENVLGDLSYGNDFEFFLFSKEKNKIVSAIEVLKRGKEEPINLGNGVNCYYDNCLLEFSLKPYYSKPEMVSTLRDAFTRVQNYIGDKYSLVPQSAYVFDDDEVKSKEAWIIGCSSSYNAYTLEVVTNQAFKDNLRSAGAHNHMGSKFLQEDFDARINTIKLCDIYLGCSNVIYDKDTTSVSRRVYYGQPSNHRCPPHGVEYRVLSSSLLSSKEATELNFDLLQFTMSHFKNNTVESTLKLVDPAMVQAAINTGNKELAEKVLKNVNTPSDFMERIHMDYEWDFYKTWGLNK